MVEKSSFTTKKRSGRGDSELDWGNASHPWSNEIATSTNLGMLNGNPTVPQKPVADASVDIDNGNRSTEFTFDASGTTDPQDSTLTYEWVFGDGTTTSTQQATVVHTFDTKGTYTVELTATNELGESDTDTVQVIVEIDKKIISSDTTLEPGTHEYPGLHIESGVTVTAKGDPTADTNGNYGGVKIITDGPITIDGTLTAVGQGHPSNSGPGTADSYKGAGYGGRGGGSHNDPSYMPDNDYGDKTVANRLGSGDWKPGGGSVWLVTTDEITVNGTITVNGEDISAYSPDGCSGGSIRIEAPTISGDGLLSAKGRSVDARDGHDAGGGGGRILLKGDASSGSSTNVRGGHGHGGYNTWDGGDGENGTVYTTSYPS